MKKAARLIYDVAELKEAQGLAANIAVSLASLGGAPPPDAEPAGDFSADLEFAVGGDAILLQASVHGGWKVGCGRCLREHVAPFESKTEETYPADAVTIDAAPLLLEAALVEIPIRSLCVEDCKGLCSSCGKNLNDGPCACRRKGAAEQPKAQSPFDALKKLKK